MTPESVSNKWDTLTASDVTKAVIGAPAAKAHFVRTADLYENRSEGPLSAQNDRPKTRPAVCIVFRYRLRLRKGRSLKNTNTLKILYFLNAPF